MFSRSTPGFRFKDNRLHIFTADSIMLIDSWPELRAAVKTRRRDSWIPFDPEFRLVKPYRRSVKHRKKPDTSSQLEMDFCPSLTRMPSVPLKFQRKKAFDSFRFSLPKPVVCRVEKFTNRQWILLRLFKKEPRAVEVCASNPALTFAMVHAGQFRPVRGGDTLQFAADHILEKQKVLLHCLNFPNTKSAVKTLGKLVPESINLLSLIRMRTFLKEERCCKILNHLPKINSGVIELLSMSAVRDSLPMVLLEEVSRTKVENYRAGVANTLGEFLYMVEQLQKNFSPRRLTSIEKIDTMNTELLDEFNRHEATRLKHRRFPRAPVPGTDTINPIRSELELIQEGKAQHNCVASYTNRVLDRSVFIYRVDDPERATLSIVRGPDGNWEIDQLKLKFNQPPSKSTYDEVHLWLDQYRVAV